MHLPKKLQITISVLLISTAAVIVTAAPKKAASPKLSSALQAALQVDQAVIEALDRVRPAVVSIVVKEKVRTATTKIITINPKTGQTDIRDEPARDVFQEAARASGIIVNSQGYILTNKHVVNFKGDILIKIFLASGDILDGYVVDTDPVNDLAILRVDGGPFQAATLGNSDIINIGQTVVAIGYSLGRLENTVTRGIISGLGRSVVADAPGGILETISDTIQTDASINPGNSGGPLINLRGEVIGINTALERDGRGISYSIPINLAKPAVKTVLTSGRIIRARLGLRYVMITPDLRDARALPVKNGALIAKGSEDTGPSIIPNGPADKAGLKEGDIIVEVEGRPLNISNSLQNEISKYDPGKTIKLTVVRAGAKLKISTTLDEFPR